MTKRAKIKAVDINADVARELKNPEFRYHYEQRRLVHEVAIAVRSMRQAQGLTQAQLAARIGVKQPMIARIEKGLDMRRPKWDTLYKIAIALGKQLKLSFMALDDDGHPLVEVDGKAPHVDDDDEAAPSRA